MPILRYLESQMVLPLTSYSKKDTDIPESA